MNIFDIFCDGNGRINETNMSSVLGFLLHPGMAHNLGKEPLLRLVSGANNRGILQDIIRQSPENGISISYEERVNDQNNNATRFIDLVIRINDQRNNLAWVVAIENKINDAAINQEGDQLQQEYRFLRESLNANNNGDIPVLFIFITPNLINNNADYNAVANLMNGTGDILLNLCWFELDNNFSSISNIVSGLLEDEAKGKIQPASSHTSLFLRSMINFIRNGFRRFNPVFDGTEYERGEDIGRDTLLDSWPQGTYELAGILIDAIFDAATHHINNEPDLVGLNVAIKYTTTRAALFLTANNQANLPANSRKPSPIVRIYRQQPTNNTQICVGFKRNADIDPGLVANHPDANDPEEDFYRLETTANGIDFNLFIQLAALNNGELNNATRQLINTLVAHAINGNRPIRGGPAI